jgi:hypothetical protein
MGACPTDFARSTERPCIPEVMANSKGRLLCGFCGAYSVVPRFDFADTLEVADWGNEADNIDPCVGNTCSRYDCVCASRIDRGHDRQSGQNHIGRRGSGQATCGNAEAERIARAIRTKTEIVLKTGESAVNRIGDNQTQQFPDLYQQSAGLRTVTEQVQSKAEALRNFLCKVHADGKMEQLL